MHLQRPVALKVMRPELLADAVASQRFAREARATAAIRHENIVTIYQVGQQGELPFLAMELLEGESLESLLEKGGSPWSRRCASAVRWPGRWRRHTTRA
jgi:serine/threonine protein kinase